MALRRLFSQPDTTGCRQRRAQDRARGQDPETAAVRRIVAQLAALPAEQRRHVAGFAYILSRVANADLDISAEEVALMEKTIVEIADLPEAQAVLIVEIARNQAELYGGTEDYVVTREFAQQATAEQREKLLRCCFAIGAADSSISAAEISELDEIGRELGFTDQEVRAIRGEFRDQMSAIQQMRQAARGRDAAGLDVRSGLGVRLGQEQEAPHDRHKKRAKQRPERPDDGVVVDAADHGRSEPACRVHGRAGERAAHQDVRADRETDGDAADLGRPGIHGRAEHRGQEHGRQGRLDDDAAQHVDVGCQGRRAGGHGHARATEDVAREPRRGHRAEKLGDDVGRGAASPRSGWPPRARTSPPG